jgi:hypothetical protein
MTIARLWVRGPLKVGILLVGGPGTSLGPKIWGKIFGFLVMVGTSVLCTALDPYDVYCVKIINFTL